MLLWHIDSYGKIKCESPYYLIPFISMSMALKVSCVHKKKKKSMNSRARQPEFELFVTFGKNLIYHYFDFLIYKMGTITISTSQNYCKD